MKKVDIVSALVLIGLSALVAFDTSDLPYWSTFAPGPAFAPVWVAAAGALIGGGLLFQAVMSAQTEPAEWPDGTGARHVILAVAALWALLAMLPYLGTAISGVIFMLFSLLVIGRQPVLPALFATILTIALIQSVFVLWLNIPLPKGVFGF